MPKLDALLTEHYTMGKFCSNLSRLGIILNKTMDMLSKHTQLEAATIAYFSMAHVQVLRTNSFFICFRGAKVLKKNQFHTTFVNFLFFENIIL